MLAGWIADLIYSSGEAETKVADLLAKGNFMLAFIASELMKNAEIPN